MIGRRLPMPVAQPAKHAPDKKRQDYYPEEPAQEQQRQQEPQAETKSPQHGNPLFLSLYL